MQIIKAGKLPQEKKYRLTCNTCGTVFDFKLREARFTSDQREGDFYTISCPLEECERTLTFYPRSLREVE
jgi:ribosomal protein S27E